MLTHCRRRGAGDLSDRPYRCNATVGAAQLVEPVMRPFGSKDGRDSRLHGILWLFELACDQVLATQMPAQLGPEFRLQRSDGQPAPIGGFVDVVTCVASA